MRDLFHFHRHHDHREHYVWLYINNLAVLLEPSERTFLVTTLNINQNGNLSIIALDATSHPVVAAFDSPPVWTNSDNTAATLVASADGTTAVLTTVALGGKTTVGVTAVISGATFTASVDIVVATAVASIQIVVTPVPKT